MKEFSNDIIEWYHENRRRLPWRDTKDPYRIWLSEVILQQTRVNQGLPYYLQFVDTFPTVKDLANAPEDTVLRLWQGLGYYSRARNLHRCAKTVAGKYDGRFPSSFGELILLPGIGTYTAAAIASIAFNQNVAVVDGNVYRVLARIFGVTLDISSTEGKKYFSGLANTLISSTHPGDHNQAVMEFGATHCTPMQPKCPTCPFVTKCVAYKQSMVDQLPVKERKAGKRTRFFYYFILRNDGKIAMKKRTGRDIWNGLYEFHLVESDSEKKVDEILKKDALLSGIRAQGVKETGSLRHILTHQVLHIRFFETGVKKENLMKIKKLSGDLSFISASQAGEVPKPIAITRYLETAGY
jgi:A/G-specific adenine glycosylase